jgi:hypothetical protein
MYSSYQPSMATLVAVDALCISFVTCCVSKSAAMHARIAGDEVEAGAGAHDDGLSPQAALFPSQGAGPQGSPAMQRPMREAADVTDQFLQDNATLIEEQLLPWVNYTGENLWLTKRLPAWIKSSRIQASPVNDEGSFVVHNVAPGEAATREEEGIDEEW